MKLETLGENATEIKEIEIALKKLKKETRQNTIDSITKMFSRHESIVNFSKDNKCSVSFPLLTLDTYGNGSVELPCDTLEEVELYYFDEELSKTKDEYKDFFGKLTAIHLEVKAQLEKHINTIFEENETYNFNLYRDGTIEFI